MGTSSNLLRPMGIGDILDGAINLYRRNFLLLIGISAWVYIPIYLLFLVMPQWIHILLNAIVPTFVTPVVTVAIS